MMHHYQHPGTGHVITSPLPPDHPEMQCLQAGGHVAGATRWGILGVLAAVFPARRAARLDVLRAITSE